MKKMQCEACGSNDIKKVSEDLFVCESCGTQYHAAGEISGTVRIDHTDDIKHAVKRAEQSLDQGDLTKALGYLTAALDLAPDSKEIAEKIKAIQKKPQNMYILEKTVSPEDSFIFFLRQFKETRHIAPDIYSEIEIISKTEGYYPLAVMSGSYSGSYSGTACFKKQVPVPVETYEEKMINGVRRQVRVTKTEYKTVIDKMPTSGLYPVNCRKTYTLSDSLFANCSDLCLSKGSDKKNYVSFLETYFDSLLAHHADEAKPLDLGKISPTLSMADKTIDEKLLDRAKKTYYASIDKTCANAAEKRIGGNYSENVRYNREIKSQTVSFIYVPLQVIKYAYLGDFYLSVMPLIGDGNAQALIYPEYDTIFRTEKEGKREVQEIQYKSSYGIWTWFFSAVMVVFGWLISQSNSSAYMFCYAAALILAVLGALQTVLGIINTVNANKQRQEIQAEYQQKTEKLTQNAEDTLAKQYQLFFSSYNGEDSIQKCTAAVRKGNAFRCHDEEITCCQTSKL